MNNSLIAIADELKHAADKLAFAPPVAYVYNPLDYAWQPHKTYLQQYGHGPKEVILLGMNPGPFGMAQTGVPFGSVSLVRDWLGISGPVKSPPKIHPKRPILGFACRREEVSGQRLWGWAQARFIQPEPFFKRFFVWNYCPLAFIEASGKNRTPDQLPAQEQAMLYEPCDRALRTLVQTLRPRWLIGIGAFAAKRAAKLKLNNVQIGQILHPSPANPMANRSWAIQIDKQLSALGIF